VCVQTSQLGHQPDVTMPIPIALTVGSPLLLLGGARRYKTNLGLAESLEWGRNAGCAFALGSCGAFMRRQPQQTYFCPKEQRRGEQGGMARGYR
jgi:hypothetical protein